jgi:hypothetical protein
LPLPGQSEAQSALASGPFEIEYKSNLPLRAQLEAQLALANDPDRQLAFDERAAFLEYECGLSRAEAERQAAGEIVPVQPYPGPLLQEWWSGLASLSPSQSPCPGYRGTEWSEVHANALGFLQAFGAQAEALGWTTSELFAVHREAGTVRVDHCGALVLSVGGRVSAVTADEIRFRSLTYRRKAGQPEGVPVWSFPRGNTDTLRAETKPPQRTPAAEPLF